MAFTDPFGNFLQILWRTDDNGNRQSVEINNEQHKIVGGRIILSEIPDEMQKVQISGMYESKINIDIASDTYYKVNYNSGEVFFHPSKEGQSIVITRFYGRGYIRLYGTRLILANENGLYSSDKLESVIDEIFVKYNSLTASLQNQISNEVQNRNSEDISHKNSTSAHPAENLSYSGLISGGGTTVKSVLEYINTRINTLVGSSGSSNSEIVDARVPENGYTPGRSIVVVGDAIRDLQSKTKRVDLTQTLSPGTSILTADQNGSELDMTVYGRTLAPVFSNGCESLTGWSLSGVLPVLDTTRKLSGNASYKFAATTSTSSVMTKDIMVPLDIAKYYIVMAWVYIETFASGGGSVMSLRDVGTSTTRYSAVAATTTIGSWQLVYLKIPTNNTLVGSGFRLYLGHTSNNDFVFNMDDVRLYEVSAAEYAAIGTTITGEAIDAYWPYVSGKQHVQGVVITKQGRNLYVGGIAASNSSTYTEGVGTITVTTESASFRYVITKKYSVIPNTVYTLSYIATNVLGTDSPVIAIRKGSDGSNINTGSAGIGARTVTFNTGSETEVQFYIYGSYSTAEIQTKRYENIQLELGSTATPSASSEPPQSVILPVTLAEVGGYRDKVYSQGGEWMLSRVVERDLALNGSLAWWHWNSNVSGVKRMVVSDYFNAAKTGTGSRRMVDYLGRVYLDDPSGNGSAGTLSIANQNLIFSVYNVDSGWTDSLNPGVNAIKALFNGWKASANNGSAYTSWVSILDGSAPATNTEAYVAANKAPNWTAWATLDYALANAAVPVPIANAEGSITLHPGGNQISIETGVIQREKVVPKLDTGRYYILSHTDSYWGAARLSKASSKMLAVYKGADIDTRWRFTAPTGVATATISPEEYDPNATYYVTYLARDKYALTANVTETTATWRTGLGGVVSDLVQTVSELRQSDDRQDFADDYIEAQVINQRVDFNALSGLIKHGTGSPIGVVSAPVATLYLRKDGGANTTLYVKESGAGNTGWVAK